MIRRIVTLLGLSLFLLSTLACGVGCFRPSFYAWRGGAQRMWQVTLEDLTLKVELIRDWPANAVKTEVRKGPTSIGTFEPEVVQLTSDYEVTSKFAGVRYTRGMRRTPVFLNRPESELRVQAPDDILRFPFTAGRYYPGQPGIFLSKQLQWSELSIRLIAVVLGSMTLVLVAQWGRVLRFVNRFTRKPARFEVIVKDERRA